MSILAKGLCMFSCFSGASYSHVQCLPVLLRPWVFAAAPCGPCGNRTARSRKRREYRSLLSPDQTKSKNYWFIKTWNRDCVAFCRCRWTPGWTCWNHQQTDWTGSQPGSNVQWSYPVKFGGTPGASKSVASTAEQGMQSWGLSGWRRQLWTTSWRMHTERYWVSSDFVEGRCTDWQGRLRRRTTSACGCRP